MTFATIQPGHPSADGVRAILAGLRTPGPSNGRDERREMERKSKYGAKLLDPRWQKKRLTVLQRDNWTCLVCGATDKTLHVHHAAYAPYGGDPWDADDDVLFTACTDCHDALFNQQPDAIYRLLALFGFVGIRTPEDIELLEETARIDHWERTKQVGVADSPELRIEALREAIRLFPILKAGRIADRDLE